MSERDPESSLIGRFSTQAELDVVKALLEGAGIECFTGSESLSVIFPGIQVNELELYVKKSDEQLAKEILAAKFDKKGMK